MNYELCKLVALKNMHLREVMVRNKEKYYIFESLLPNVCITKRLSKYNISGRSTNNFFICIGKDIDNSQAVKKNYAVNCVFVFSFLVYTIAGVRTVYFKLWANKQDKLNQGHFQTNNFGMNSQNLFSFTANGLILFWLLCCLLVPVKINRLSMAELGTYPNYIWFYVMHHVTPSSTVALTVILYFGKTPTLRKHVLDEFKQKWQRIRAFKRSQNKVYTITSI